MLANMRLLLGLVMTRLIVLVMVLSSRCWPWRDVRRVMLVTTLPPSPAHDGTADSVLAVARQGATVDC
jgi:hypothetical protein